MFFKRCRICGSFLDPGEWCRCDEYEEPEVEESRRPLPPRKRISLMGTEDAGSSEVQYGEI